MIEPLNDLAERCHENAIGKGFYDGTLDNTERGLHTEVGLRLALIHSEVTEVLEAVRKQLGTEAEEIADILIRVFDYAAWREIDLDGAVAAKMEKNAGRTYLHGHSF